MQIRYIPALTTLLAGAVTCIISIINRFEVMYSLKVLLAVLVVFYILGLAAQKIIVAVMNGEGNNNIVLEEAGFMTEQADEIETEAEPEDKTDMKIDEA